LFGALAQDVPAFMVWAAAVFAVGAIGWIPGLKPVSRGLLALVIVVLVLNNYQQIIDGLSAPLGDASNATSGGSGGGDENPLASIFGSLGGLGSASDILGGLPSGDSPWVMN